MLRISGTLLDRERARFKHALIVTEGVFSMDGDLAPLPELSDIANRYDAWLMSDDAHGIGVLGGGRGSAFATHAPADIPLQMGTLSKAIGSYGAYLCASRDVIDLMHNRARTLIYSTGLPPSALGGGDRGARHHRERSRFCGPAAPEGARLHPRRQSAGGGERDRAGDDRRCRCRDCGRRRCWKTKVFSSLPSVRRPCRREPHGCVSRSMRHSQTRQSSGWPASFATAF